MNRTPGHWEICSNCRGNGSHSKHLGAYSAEEFNEAFPTDEEREDYFTGKYDEPCHSCDSNGKVWVYDGPCVASEDDDVSTSDCACKACREQVAEWEAESRAERKAEFYACGGRPEDWY